MHNKHILLLGLSVFSIPFLANGQNKGVSEFNTIDIDNNSLISLEEFSDLGNTKRSTRFITHHFNEMDLDGDGQLNKEEFKNPKILSKFMRKRMPMGGYLDTNKDSKISFEELNSKKARRLKLSQEEFNTLDSNGDNLLDKEEFKKIKRFLKDRKKNKK